MSTHVQPFTITFPEGYDAQAEFEAPFRGYLPDVIVQLEDGSRRRLSFIDPVRLGQSLSSNAQCGRAYYAERGLVILPEVSTEAIHKAVHGLWEDGYFTPSGHADAEAAR
jgi:hypothetical protein